MVQFGIGQPVRRIEDARLLTGHGRYIDDINLPRQAYLHVVRSPHAHARIAAIDSAAARAAPGVFTVFTHTDLAANGIGTLPCIYRFDNPDGSPMATPPRPALADGVVRHVGDPVAAVVADTPDRARDAAELIAIDFDPLPAVVEALDALGDDAPQLWEEAPGNRCYRYEAGDAAAVDAAFSSAAHVTRLELANNRIVVAAMEPRGALAAYDDADRHWTLWTSTQGGHFVRDQLANTIFGVPVDRVRVITPDVGGGFGMKVFLYPEHVLVAWAARRISRPVKWTGERSADGFGGDTQGRDNVASAELALDSEGRMLALRMRMTANLGAYLSNYGPLGPTVNSGMLSGAYTTPLIHVSVTGTFTNTVPVDAYRGNGRPEMSLIIERLVDQAAGELNLDPADLRQRNFISPAMMPFTSPLGETYDSGEFAALLDAALDQVDWADRAARKAAARERGRLLGIGLAYYVEGCAAPRPEGAHLRINPDGNAVVTIGTQSTGMGHETAYAQLVAETLGIDIGAVSVVQGDTDLVATGGGSTGSRSLAIGGVALLDAAGRVRERARLVAAHLLEAAPADLDFAEGVFTVTGTDRSVEFTAVARAAHDYPNLPPDLEPQLAASGAWQPSAKTYPNGAHVCELEIDPETGAVRLQRYLIVDDFGVAVNPLLVAGQVHGGIVQGIGQILFEQAVYDRDSGQLLTGSFMDYCLPRADDLPTFELDLVEVPCTTNPLGAKGAGEAGATGSLPAVVNALLDALGEAGVTEISLPATPERVWQAIQATR